MKTEERNLSLIFHSGSYDRLYHGFSIALAALALGREVKCFFSYWALQYLKKESPVLQFDETDPKKRNIFEELMSKGHIQGISEVLNQIKAMGSKIYACTGSMGLFNISRNELVKEVDMSMGLTTFLTEAGRDQILFI